MTVGRGNVICLWCSHLIINETESMPHDKICTAFPEGIPGEIWSDDDDGAGGFDHRLPHPNDNGIQFEKASYDMLRSRRFFDRFSSPDVIEGIFEHETRNLRRVHEKIIEVKKAPPMTIRIVPLDVPEASEIRKRCADWGFDLTTNDNKAYYIPNETYQAIQNDMEAYVQWLEAQFVDAKTPKQGARIFAKINGELGMGLYPHNKSNK